MGIGSLVELIDDKWIGIYPPHLIFPVKGEIYTVRGFDNKYPAIYLEEIVNPEMMFPTGEYGELSFLIRRFRELVPPIDVKEMVEQYELV